jgi:RNA 2',3'-cyclic 3'-phosphodiesterase
MVKADDTMVHKQHYFFAVKLPYEAKKFLHEWVEEHKVNYPFKKWVHQEDYHITLAFLGFAEHEMLQKVIEKVKFTLKNESSFNLSFHKLGIFGKETMPRIFWAGVLESDSLSTIQKKVYNQCIDVGFSLDKKPFRPHITIARKWNSENPFQVESLTKLMHDNDEIYKFQVNEIVLYKTEMNEVPKYKEVHVFKLSEEVH